MNLRDQLTAILPEILPVESADAVKGTELIELVKARLQQTYSDATLRYHFSILSRDPTSPIAKVERGQGYFRRSARSRLEGAGEVIRMTQALLMEESEGDEVERDLGRATRLRVLFARHAELRGHSPVLFTANQPGATGKEALWKYPDAALVEWDLSTLGGDGGGVALDRKMARLKTSMGGQPFRLSAIKLVLDVENSDFREAFFQCLCNSRWAHRGELVVAERIDDEVIAETLRDLGQEYGISVSTLGLSLEQMDEWPNSTRLAELDADSPELLAILGRIEPQRICDGKLQPNLDWEALGILREENTNFDRLLDWIADCLESGRPETLLENAELG